MYEPADRGGEIEIVGNCPDRLPRRSAQDRRPYRRRPGRPELRRRQDLQRGGRGTDGLRRRPHRAPHSRARDQLREIRQRNAELAIVNEVGQALAKQLDLTAITELVGARLHETFPDTDLFVALYDAKTNLISFPYEIEASGKRYHTDPIPAEGGLTAKVIHSREPLLVRTGEEAVALGAIVGRAMSQSWLGVPIIAGDELIGVLAVESETKPYAFDESDARLLSTLGASTGVALRNARLFDETKRLLTETEQRNAELAVINEIGAALAKQLDFQAIVDAVGDRVSRSSATRPVHRHPRSDGHEPSFPYGRRWATRLPPVPRRRPELGTSSSRRRALRPARRRVRGARRPLVVWAPQQSPRRANPGRRSRHGRLAASSQPTNAYSEADERLVSTSRRAWAWRSRTRACSTRPTPELPELAIINSVQEGLAAKLDMDAMYNLVGQKMVEIFDADATDIGLIDAPHDLVQFKFGFEKPVGPLL